MGGKETTPDRQELSALADSLAAAFVQRRDVFARQLDDGSYVSIRRPLQARHLLAHLCGDLTLGTYLLNEQSEGHFMVLDADDAPDGRRLGALAGVLSQMGGASYLEDSRRGGHLWMFFADPLPGRDIRRFGRGLLEHFGIEGLELFPKQDWLATGPGSLIRLPFGVHRRSGRRYGFYLPDGQPLAPSLREQIHALRAPETVSKTVFDRFRGYLSDSDDKPISAPPERPQRGILPGGETAPLSERIKAAIPARQFILRYVELSPGGKGICPFHDDTVASFSVNDQGNYWRCFGCEKGGSIIDYWMAWRGCDYQSAVSELAEMLL